MSRSIKSVLFFFAICLAIGCGRPDDDGPISAATLDLSGIANEGEPAVGVTYDEEGRLLVLTRSGLIYERVGNDFELFQEVDPRVAPFGFTDITSLGDGKYALSSRSDGFLLDVNANTFEQHFCYEPGWEPGNEPDPDPGNRPAIGGPGMIQTTYALTAANGRIFAQPQTTLEDDPSDVRGSFFSTYDIETGGDLSWTETFDTKIQNVGGMAHLSSIEGQDDLLVARDDQLTRVMLHDGTYTAISLGKLGISETVVVEGLALDAEQDELVFIDATSNELRILPLSGVLNRLPSRDEVIGS